MIDFEKQTAQQKEHTAGVRILLKRQRRTGRQDSTVPEKGVMQKDSSCSAFRYDPLKRKPKQPVELPQFDASDFEL